MGLNYDELLEDNPFFQEIQEAHREILENAARESWVICVPRVGSIIREDIDIETVLEHVLVPRIDEDELNLEETDIEVPDDDNIGICKDNKDYIGVNKNNKDNIGVNKNNKDNIGISEDNKDNLGIPKDNEDNIGVDKNKDNIGISKDNKDNIGINKDYKDNLVRKNHNKDDVNVRKDNTEDNIHISNDHNNGIHISNDHNNGIHIINDHKNGIHISNDHDGIHISNNHDGIHISNNHDSDNVYISKEYNKEFIDKTTISKCNPADKTNDYGSNDFQTNPVNIQKSLNSQITIKEEPYLYDTYIYQNDFNQPRQSKLNKVHELNKQLKENRADYTSLAQKNIIVRNDSIQFVNAPNEVILILFKETFYVNRHKFQLWCTDRPLNGHFVSDPGNLTDITNIKDCVHLLSVEGSDRKILEQISFYVDKFILENPRLELLNLYDQKELIQTLYEDCRKIALTKTGLRKKLQDFILLKLNVAVETFVQNCLQDKLFEAVAANTALKDALLNKAIRNLQDVQLKHFPIDSKYYSCIPPAKNQLNCINNHLTILGKENCLKQVLKIITNNQRKLSADSLLQLFVFLLIKSNVTNWFANIHFLKEFGFVKSTNTEIEFLIANLEAAIEYIYSGCLSKELQSEIIKIYISVDNQRDLQKLYEAISVNHLEIVKGSFGDIVVEPNKIVPKCHPLCSCDNCESKVFVDNKIRCNNIDDKGQTPLHIASIFGVHDVTQFLIKEGADLNIADSFGRTPLHYACMKGHQHDALILLHSGADLNSIDGDFNSPLHLAAGNGHENCVKALIFYSENSSSKLKLNQRNKKGDTALHLAARWGFSLIVQVLLQFGAIAAIENCFKQKPSDVAHNIFIKMSLQAAENRQESGTSLQSNATTDFTPKEPEDLLLETCEERNGHTFGVRPRNIDEKKKCELLLKAVEMNDLQLVRFYLGMQAQTMPLPQKSKCHPLCDCEKCQENFKPSTTPLKVTNVNLCNFDGFTALHTAAKFGRLDILRLLLDSGALVKLSTYKHHYNVLHVACMNKQLKVIAEILKCGESDIDVCDSYGNTTLHYAASMGFEKITEFLLKNGAKVDVKNNFEKTALEVAEERGQTACIRVLRGYLKGQVCREEELFAT